MIIPEAYCIKCGEATNFKHVTESFDGKRFHYSMQACSCSSEGKGTLGIENKTVNV